jgi:hypothetical protein
MRQAHAVPAAQSAAGTPTGAHSTNAATTRPACARCQARSQSWTGARVRARQVRACIARPARYTAVMGGDQTAARHSFAGGQPRSHAPVTSAKSYGRYLTI